MNDDKMRQLRGMGYTDEQIEAVRLSLEGFAKEVGTVEKRGVWTDDEIEGRRAELAKRRAR